MAVFRRSVEGKKMTRAQGRPCCHRGGAGSSLHLINDEKENEKNINFYFLCPVLVCWVWGERRVFAKGQKTTHRVKVISLKEHLAFHRFYVAAHRKYMCAKCNCWGETFKAWVWLLIRMMFLRLFQHVRIASISSCRCVRGYCATGPDRKAIPSPQAAQSSRSGTPLWSRAKVWCGRNPWARLVRAAGRKRSISRCFLVIVLCFWGLRIHRVCLIPSISWFIGVLRDCASFTIFTLALAPKIEFVGLKNKPIGDGSPPRVNEGVAWIEKALRAETY